NRRAIISDLSPAAAFISYNYNTPINTNKFELELRGIVEQVKKECEWLYETRHVDGRVGRINFTVWSDVFVCPYCKNDVIFWETGVDHENGKVLDAFQCQNCKAQITKTEANRAKFTVQDPYIGSLVERSRQVPVMINYSLGKTRYEKKPDSFDLALLERINNSEIPFWVPIFRLPEGFNTEQPKNSHGATHVHHFYTKRNLWVLSCLFDKLRRTNSRYLILGLSITSSLVSLLTRYNMGHRGNGQVSGTLYIPSLVAETSVIKVVENKIRDIANMSELSKDNHAIISTQSTTSLKNIPDNSIDYVFTDPPFGGNLMYSELNFLWEAWLKVFTNNTDEAIVNNVQKKNLENYRELMESCFKEMYRILKPGRWITVEFHNSKASVWNAIQDSLSHAGFVVAQVTVLDKQQGSFKQVTSAGAVKNDLVINAYKAREGFAKRLVSQAGQGLEVDFIREHLGQLPLSANIERSKEMLYSKYLAYYVQHGYQVMYNGEQFYHALPQWGFEERDSYWFADEAQANEYEKRKAKTFGKGGIQAQAVLFVSDERSARQWIWNFLDQP
ncbi:MAG TPA: DNA methyltransferase, partial [Bacteroidales bacterium]|nr:DNA methyltransferase [Bacteroidales bacterium]